MTLLLWSYNTQILADLKFKVCYFLDINPKKSLLESIYCLLMAIVISVTYSVLFVFYLFFYAFSLISLIPLMVLNLIFYPFDFIIDAICTIFFDGCKHLLSIIFLVINVFYNVFYTGFNLIENLLYYPSVFIDSFLQKIKLRKRFVLFLIYLSCMCCLIFGNHWGINFHAALVAFCTFSIIMVVELYLSNKSIYYKKITDSTKLMYTLLSAAPALIVFWLESSDTYLFATNTKNILVLVIAVIMPTLLMACYFCADIFCTKQIIDRHFQTLPRELDDLIIKDCCFDLIFTRVIIMDQLLNLPDKVIQALTRERLRQALKIQEVCKMLRDRFMTLEQLSALSDNALQVLEIPEAVKMFSKEFIKMEFKANKANKFLLRYIYKEKLVGATLLYPDLTSIVTDYLMGQPPNSNN